MRLRFLLADCEPADARDARRASVGQSAGEAYAALLRLLAADAQTDIALPADPAGDPPGVDDLTAYDGVILTGSPLHLYEPSAAARREVAFMRDVFRSGTPAFGSCAGLQVAVVAAGGTVRPLPKAHEAGFARRIWPTEAGRDHPLLAGRPPAFDAPALHGDEVDRLPPNALHLAQNQHTRVQAAEIRYEGGGFWGVQYHPELSLYEIAAALRRDADTLVDDGIAADGAAIEAQAALVEALGNEPERRDLMWRLGVDQQVATDAVRQLEVRNFIAHLVRPTQARRRR